MRRWSLSKPDLDDLCFARNTGEFGLISEEAFDEHIEKLDKLNKFFKNRNGDRMQLITREERLWYQSTKRMAK
jgi:hypothetical protein